MTKPNCILFLSDRQARHNRAIFRGILSIFHKNNGWDSWNLPVIEETEMLDNYLNSNRVAGVIGRELNETVSAHLRNIKIPFVSIGGTKALDENIAVDLTLDEHSVSIIAAKEFSNLGLNNWGFVHWEGHAWSEYRKKRFKICAEHLGADLSIRVIPKGGNQEWGAIQETANWLTSLEKPCGIFACNDEAALDVVRAARLADISIPDQIAIIGVDNDPLLCESSETWLSSIELHTFDLGKEAATLLDHRIKNDSALNTAISPESSFVVRESSHQVDKYLLIYQQAMDHIRTNQLKGLQVTELAELCVTSKRGLERAFNRYGEMTPARVIREKRKEAILVILRSQNIDLESLAEQTGFSDASGLSNFIIRMTGASPTEHRKHIVEENSINHS